MRWFVVLEDGGRLLAEPREAGLHPFIEEAAVGRALGLGVGVVVQTLHGIDPRLHAHLGGIKVLLRTADATDTARLGGAMGLTREQLAWAQTSLQPGLAILQVAGPWPAPFVVRIAPLERVAVSDEEVLASSAVLRALPVIWADEEHRVSLASESPAPAAAAPASGRDAVDAASRRYLATVARYPARPSSYYAKACKLNGRRAVEVREGLIARGLVRAHTVATSSSGRPAIVLELTDAGQAALRAFSSEAS